VTALWLASGQIPATTLGVLINEHQVKDGTALEFLLETMATLKTEKGGAMVVNVIKKSGNSHLYDFINSVLFFFLKQFSSDYNPLASFFQALKVD